MQLDQTYVMITLNPEKFQNPQKNAHRFCGPITSPPSKTAIWENKAGKLVAYM